MDTFEFTRRDLNTFLLGALTAAGMVIGQAFITLDSDTTTDIGIWARNLGTDLAGAMGNYLVTYLVYKRRNRGG